jgi:thiamine transport system ATP-binding protein
VSALEVRGVVVRFGDVTVLDRADLVLESGEIVALLGPSGSGKTTLLRVIAGIVHPDGGVVSIGSIDVTSTPIHLRRVGMVFQDNQLFPHRSTIENIAFGLKMRGVSRPERTRRAADWLERIGLGGFDDRRVTELSGGEAKRVALARTLIAEPAVLLLDEPLTGLDRELHDRLTNELAALLRSTGVTTLLVTHDAEEAGSVADRVVQIDEINNV